MGFNQAGNTVIHRFPVAVPLMDRVPATIATSPYSPFLRNCFLERGANGRTFVIKRPGISLAYSYGATSGQGLTYYNNNVYAVGSNNLYRLNGAGANAYSIGAGWTNTSNAGWSARRQATSFVFQNKIFVMGGYDGVSHYSDIWASADGITWSQLASVAPWGKRVGMKAVIFNNQIYVMGGANAGVFYNDVWVSSDGVEWNLLTSAASWSARTSFGLLAFNNGMFVIGGALLAGNSDEVWFSTDGIAWNRVVSGAGFGTLADLAASSTTRKCG